MKKLIIFGLVFLCLAVSIQATLLTLQMNTANGTINGLVEGSGATYGGAYNGALWLGYDSGTKRRQIINLSYVCAHNDLGGKTITSVKYSFRRDANVHETGGGLTQAYPIYANGTFNPSTVSWTGWYSGGTTGGVVNLSWNILLSNTTQVINQWTNATLNATYLDNICKGQGGYYNPGALLLIDPIGESTATNLDQILYYASGYLADTTLRPILYVNFEALEGGDTVPPTITPNYPVNTEPIKYNGTLSFSTNEVSNCTINRTEWIRNNTMGGITNIFYNPSYNNLPQGAIKINLSCGDASKNNASYILNFTIDTAPPVITIGFNNSYFTNLVNLSFNVSDTYSLKNVSYYSDCLGNYTNKSISTNPFNYLSPINITTCALGGFQLNISSCDNLTNCINSTYSYTSMARLRILAYDLSDYSIINNYDIYKDGILQGSTTTGVYNLDNLTGGNITITIDAPPYELNNTVITINQSYKEYNFTLFKTNSLRITIRDEITNLLLSGLNVTLNLYSVTTAYNYTATNGTLFIYNITPGTYTAQFSASGYSVRLYTIAISDRSSQALDVYLTQSLLTTILTVKNQNTLEIQPEVLISMYRFINTSWSPIESKITDITGKAQFSYNADVQYRFYLSKSGYEDFIFYLNPILFDNYEVKIKPLVEVVPSSDYDRVAIIYSPTQFKQGINNFTFLIQCPYGELISYGYTLSYPDGVVNNVDNNALGSQLSDSINITSTSVFDKVYLTYFYESSISGAHYFNATFEITQEGIYANNTMMANNEKTYGLGLFERVFILTIISLLVVGLSALMGKTVMGLVLNSFIFGYFIYIGFISVWFFILPLILTILLISRGGE